jgi:hypothetical protein
MKLCAWGGGIPERNGQFSCTNYFCGFGVCRCEVRMTLPFLLTTLMRLVVYTGPGERQRLRALCRTIKNLQSFVMVPTSGGVKTICSIQVWLTGNVGGQLSV